MSDHVISLSLLSLLPPLSSPLPSSPFSFFFSPLYSITTTILQVTGVYDLNNDVVFGGASRTKDLHWYENPEEFMIGKLLGHLTVEQGRNTWLEMVDFKMCEPHPNHLLTLILQKSPSLETSVYDFNDIRLKDSERQLLFAKPSKPIFNAVYTFQKRIFPGLVLFDVLSAKWQYQFPKFRGGDIQGPNLNFMRGLLIHILHALSWGYHRFRLAHHDLHTANILREQFSYSAMQAGFQTYTTVPRHGHSRVFQVPNSALGNYNYRIIDLGFATAINLQGKRLCVGNSCSRPFQEDGDISSSITDIIHFGFDLIRSVPTNKWKRLSDRIDSKDWVDFTSTLKSMIQW